MPTLVLSIDEAFEKLCKSEKDKLIEKADPEHAEINIPVEKPIQLEEPFEKGRGKDKQKRKKRGLGEAVREIKTGDPDWVTTPKKVVHHSGHELDEKLLDEQRRGLRQPARYQW